MARLNQPAVQTQTASHLLQPHLPPLLVAAIAQVDLTPLDLAPPSAVAADVAPGAEPTDHAPLMHSLYGSPHVVVALPENN
ncbi:hypothetical protein BDV93DRAFT_560399 [Ceratobasidium sp. AG-I]|nr:hypothetical protein BDV93DRAFT_560399 [Ceratobasidium sp. AG-I]